MKIVITDLDHDSYAIEEEIARKEGFEFEFLDGAADAGSDPRAKGAAALIVQYAKIGAAEMDKLSPELKVIARYGVGVDTIDLDAAKKHGIAVVNVPDYGTQSVADHAITLALSVVRNIKTLDALARANTMDVNPAAPVHQFVDLTFGVLGFGAIGRALAEKARGLGFATQVTDPVIPAGTSEVDGFKVCSFEQLLATSDVISIHSPLTAQTEHLFNDAAFAQMKDGAILVNTSRGGLVDTDALIRAIESGKLLGAGLDVHEVEPIPTDAPITKIDRVVLSPHAAWFSIESYALLKARVMTNAIAILRGEASADDRFVVVPPSAG